MSIYQDIKRDIDTMANSAHGPDRYVVSAMARQMDAYEALDRESQKLQTGINELNIATGKLMKVQIWLIVVQIILAFVGVLVVVKQ